MKALFTAATGMEAQQTRIAVISNNIANVNTTGYKSSRAEFQDLLYETRQMAGGESGAGIQSPTGLQVGSGVQIVSTQNLFTQGTMEQTGNPMDVAIEGKGFFQVQLPSGDVGYTRAGSLAMDSNGRLVTQNGFPLQPEVRLTVQNLDRKIGLDGTITSRAPGASAIANEGQIQIFTFPNEAGLQAIGRNIYQETSASGTAASTIPGQNGSGNLNQGFLESSNVNIAEELIRMILAQRAYELNGKVISAGDQMMSATTNLR